MRKLFIILMCTGMILPNLWSQGEVLDKIIAIVGSEILLKSELDENIAMARSQGGVLPPDAECLILNQLLSQKLLVNQARLDSLIVLDEEVEGQMNARFEQILVMMNNDPQQFSDYYGMTIGEAKEKFRTDMKDQLLAQRMQQQVISDVKITPAEVIGFFNAIPVDSLPYFNSEVEIGEIVYYPEPNPDEKKKAKDKALELRTMIVDQGANFAELAKSHSDDFGSGRLGGDLGWQKRGQFVPEFEAAAYTLEKGEISEVVETEFGFHIIQLLERLGNRIHTRHILVQPVITADDMRKSQNELQEVRDLILIDSISFSKAVKDYSSDKAQSYYNDGLMLNPATGSTYFETGELDVDVYFTIDTMQVGNVSQPIKIVSDRQEAAFRMFKLVSMTEPHKASLEEDYSKIKTAAIEEKKSRRTVEWVEDKISNTYIKLDSDYEGCEALEPWLKSKKEP